MKAADLAVPALIAAAAGAAIWYISKQTAQPMIGPSTAGNDTATPGVASPATPASTTSAGATPTGTSASTPTPGSAASTLAQNFGVTGSNW